MFENDINQSKPFRSEVSKGILNIMYTADLIQRELQVVLKPYGLNDQHYNILRILNGAYPNSLCPGDIKEVLISKRGDLTRLLDKLVNLGLVERSYNEENRRSVDVKITDQGKNKIDQIKKDMKSIEKYDQNLSENEAKELNALLDKLRGKKK